MQEMLPALKALWAGDYEHNGEFWSFPDSNLGAETGAATASTNLGCGRSPITFDYAVKNNCHVMSWPLTRPFAEAELYKSQLDEAIAPNPSADKPTFALMRHTALYEDAAGRDAAIKAIQTVLGQFENLFRNLGDVNNGFPKQIPLEELTDREQYNADMLEENLMFGSPDDVIAKLKRYEALGVDEFHLLREHGAGAKRTKTFAWSFSVPK